MKNEKICLDTDILIDYLHNKKETVEAIAVIEKTADCATTALNVFELFCLAADSTKPEENNAVVQELISRLTIIHLTLGALKEAAKIFTELKKLKKKPDIRNILIGVNAKHREYTLFTATPANYAVVEGLKLYK